MTKYPKIHSKPNVMAAVAIYYGSILAGEKIDLNEAEPVFHEMGVNVDVLRQYIQGHNREIRSSGCSPEVIKTLTVKITQGHHRARKKIPDRANNAPMITCGRCGHTWKSRSRYGCSTVRCHSCGGHVNVRKILEEKMKNESN